MELNGTTLGEEAVYSCIEGHTLTGEGTRICTADAVWSGEPPMCNSKRLVTTYSDDGEDEKFW